MEAHGNGLQQCGNDVHCCVLLSLHLPSGCNFFCASLAEDQSELACREINVFWMVLYQL